MDKMIENKRGLELESVPLQVIKQVQKNFLSYISSDSDQVWWYNMKQFLSYSDDYTFKFMQTNAWHH